MKTGVILLVAFILLAALVAAPVAEAAPSTVASSGDTWATAYNSQQKTVRLSDGTLYAVYHREQSGSFGLLSSACRRTFR